MKRYKVHLSIGAVSFVHAHHHETTGGWTRFYRGQEVIAEFAAQSVQKIEEVRRLDDPPSTASGRRRASPWL